MADTFGDTPESMEACFSTSTPPTIDGLPSISCGQDTVIKQLSIQGPTIARQHQSGDQKANIGIVLPHVITSAAVERGYLAVCDHASPLPEPVGSEHLVHVLNQEALGLRQEEGHKQLQAAMVSS